MEKEGGGGGTETVWRGGERGKEPKGGGEGERKRKGRGYRDKGGGGLGKEPQRKLGA